MTNNPTVSIFANFFINDEERFLRTKDSFLSFKDISAQKWVINVRGKYKLDVLFFLHDHLGEKLSAHVFGRVTEGTAIAVGLDTFERLEKKIFLLAGLTSFHHLSKFLIKKDKN